MNWSDVAAALAVGAGIAAVWVFGLWLVSILRRDISIIDAVFSLIELSIVGVAGVVMGAAPQGRKTLLFGLLCLWSLRLTAYLSWRKWGEGEDLRYTKLRGWVDEGWPFHRFVLRQVFGLQGVTMFLLSVPLLISLAADESGSLGPISYVGVAVWAVGFVFETIGDFQLVRFKRNSANGGKVLDSGLWRYTAHPNYFGEVMMAWGLFIAALEVPWAAIGIIGPIMYTRLVVKVTGTPTLEKRVRRTRSDYGAYLERTSSFWPRPPRSHS
jgi:steroid 5-alpha reductase family enzyme